jgi:hypothetical protein
VIATIKVISNDGELARFRDLTNKSDGEFVRADCGASRESFLSDLFVGKKIKVDCQHTHSERVQRKRYREGCAESRKAHKS